MSEVLHLTTGNPRMLVNGNQGQKPHQPETEKWASVWFSQKENKYEQLYLVGIGFTIRAQVQHYEVIFARHITFHYPHLPIN